MVYEERVTCFIDILGFESHVNQTVHSDGSENESKAQNLMESIEIIREVLDIDYPEKGTSKEVTQFSDSVVISFEVSEESGVFWSLIQILWMQINLLNKNMLLRGAVTTGKLVHNNKALFGPAVIDAYRLESKAALYPRIILDESIVNIGVKAHAGHHSPKDEKYSIMNLLSQDSDDMYYIDYICGEQTELNEPVLEYPSYLENLFRIVNQGLQSSDLSVVLKYRWMRNKLEQHIEEVKSSARDQLAGDTEILQAYEEIPNFKG